MTSPASLPQRVHVPTSSCRLRSVSCKCTALPALHIQQVIISGWRRPLLCYACYCARCPQTRQSKLLSICQAIGSARKKWAIAGQLRVAKPCQAKVLPCDLADASYGCMQQASGAAACCHSFALGSLTLTRPGLALHHSRALVFLFFLLHRPSQPAVHAGILPNWQC